METKEKLFCGFKMNGFVMLFIHLVVVSAAIIACFMQTSEVMYAVGVLLFIVWCILFAGYMQLEPNEARERQGSFGLIRSLIRKNFHFVHVTWI